MALRALSSLNLHKHRLAANLLHTTRRGSAGSPLLSSKVGISEVNRGGSKFAVPNLQPPLAHAECKRWVIFSDLHVKSSSIEVCEEVLLRVHEEAQKRDAGIIFLGDFWHVRGALSVELLNRVLKALRKWEQPVIMIPGNHDQVTLGGRVHSLEPLVYAFKPGQILMINEPSICMGALWIPYRRDPAVMKAVLGQCASAPEISMVFCHADVRGAYMNDNMRSKEGLDITCFPKDLPIYSGHFHKPHTIQKGGSTLRYVGSPYQTSLSEAGQDKFFYCVERAPVSPAAEVIATSGVGEGAPTLRWREAERWVVSIGSKIIKAASPTDPVIDSAKAGDRVVVTVPVGQDYAAQQLQADLRERGVEVELQHEHNPLTRRRAAAAAAIAMERVDRADVEAAGVLESAVDAAPGSVVGAAEVPKIEDMNPFRIFESYMSQLDVHGLNITESASAAPTDPSVPPGAAQKLHDAVLREGHMSLDRLSGVALAEGTSAAATNGALRGVADGGVAKMLTLDKVTLSNFGPYGGEEAIEYPLSKRGLVLIRGQSTDGTGADSNGAGKTTLAMSVLWGLTGSLDARMVGDAKSADVTYDAAIRRTGGDAAGKASASKRKTAAGSASAKLVAEVIVSGCINAQPFEIVRRRSAKKAELHFTLNGTVLTTQAVKDTQTLIDEHLGIQGGLLQRCCFFGQHTHTMQSLLGLTDVKLKQELSALVDTTLWVAAAQDVRTRERAIKASLTELAVEKRMRKEELARAEASHADANSTADRLQWELEEAQRRGREVPTANISIADLSDQLETLRQENVKFVESTVRVLRDQHNGTKATADAAVTTIDVAINQANVEIAKLRTAKNASTTALSNLQRKLDIVLPQESNNSRIVQDLLANCTALSGSVEVDVLVLRAQHEAALAELTGVGLRINTTSLSLERLNELKPHTLGKEVVPHSHSHLSEDDACPTCGQEMPADTRDRRQQELSVALRELHAEKAARTQESSAKRKLYDSAVALQSARELQSNLRGRVADLRAEIADQTAALEKQTAQQTTAEAGLAALQKQRLDVKERYDVILAEQKSKLEGAEQTAVENSQQETALRDVIADLRRQQEEAFAITSTASAQVAMAQDRVTSALQQLAERAEAVTQLQRILANMDAKAEEMTGEGVVLERLASVFGARGIQNYVYQNVIAQLESITNAYLMILAEGGIQLALQNTGEEDEKIVKTVWVRSKDSNGEYRERALAQLSGGQWRRVSLALDFAFAELIRRRGVLRSNLMVMDEVLTHLDASGREAVGTVLRAMVQGPTPEARNVTASEVATSMPGEAEGGVDEYGVALPTKEELRTQRLTNALLGGGAYETVIVILQDLAAAELSEAFDHVDVVMKESDSSVVVLDGDNA